MKGAKMENLRSTIMKRDDLTGSEADEQTAEAREAMQNYLDQGDIEQAECICEEYFGLEPDYIFDLM